jgi:hypothetical protein
LGLAVEQQIDAAAMAAGVLERLRREALRRQSPRIRFPTVVRWVAVAAAAVLAITVFRGRGPDDSVPLAIEQALLPELEGLAADDLEQVLEVLPAEALVREGAGGTSDLNEDELSSVLRSLEG